MEKENVLTHTYDLLRYLVPQLVKFPRAQKFVLADRIQNLLTDILQLLIEAYFTRADAKRPILQKANQNSATSTASTTSQKKRFAGLTSAMSTTSSFSETPRKNSGT